MRANFSKINKLPYKICIKFDTFEKFAHIAILFLLLYCYIIYIIIVILLEGVIFCWRWGIYIVAFRNSIFILLYCYIIYIIIIILLEGVIFCWRRRYIYRCIHIWISLYSYFISNCDHNHYKFAHFAIY
jgi:hypothetical protein